MKIKTLALLFQLNLVLLLSGCSLIEAVFNYNHNQTGNRDLEADNKDPVDKENTENTQTDLRKFHDLLSTYSKNCGDRLPEDKNIYPLQVYPVKVNLQAARNEPSKLIQCGVIIDKNNQIVIGLFLSLQNARNFINSQDISNYAIIDAPVRINHPPNLEVMRLSQLNSLQTYWLTYIEYEQEKKFKIVVPTYIPPNFSLAEVEIKSGVFNRRYSLVYQGLSGECFSIYGLGFRTGGGGDFFGYEEIDIDSQIFGTEKFIYSEGHNKKSFFSPSLNILLINDSSIATSSIEGAYVFESPGSFRFSSNSSSDCKVLAVPELVKIFKSMKYLN